MNAPGWYPNPDGSGSQLYWDGQAWQQGASVEAPKKRKGSVWNVVGVLIAAVVGMMLGNAILGGEGIGQFIGQ
ncbi:DUF2510 domain-containing protein [Rhodococcus sp. NPDC055112]